MDIEKGTSVPRLIYFLGDLQEKFEWIEEPCDKKVKQGLCDEVSFICKLSHKGKKAKWYLRNQVRRRYPKGAKRISIDQETMQSIMAFDNNTTQ